MKNWPVIFTVLLFIGYGCHSNKRTEIELQSQKKIIAYIYPANDTIDISKISINQLTHINYSFAKITDGVIASGFDTDSVNITLLKKLIKEKNSNCKLLISVGGWEFSDKFSDMALNSSSRKKFISSCINYIRFFDIDGVDVDWEYPGKPGKTNNFRADDKYNFTFLLKELRIALDSLEEIDNKQYLSSIAVPAFPEFYSNIETQEIIKHLDFINLMAYDFYGEWEPVSGHQSNLFSTENPKFLSADSAVKFLLSENIPNDKIVLGVPFYSRSWKITERSNKDKIHNLGHGAGINSVYEDLLREYINLNGYEEYWDSIAAVPYLWNDSLEVFVTYENPKSVSLKCEYIKTQNLGGIMFWKYNLEAENQLLNVIYKEIYKN